MATFRERAVRLVVPMFPFLKMYFKLFPVLVLRAGFVFLLARFLVIAYLLLLTESRPRLCSFILVWIYKILNLNINACL